LRIPAEDPADQFLHLRLPLLHQPCIEQRAARAELVRAHVLEPAQPAIELDHGQGLVTRYGHNQANLVKAGDVVLAPERAR